MPETPEEPPAITRARHLLRERDAIDAKENHE